MNDAQRQRVRELRGEGYSYKKISQMLGISENTIKTFCQRNRLGETMRQSAIINKDGYFCPCCGVPVMQMEGRKEKRFCSDRCRNKWWNSHLDQVNRKANYEFICAYCKKPFKAYGNKNRKYCSHRCYTKDRFGGIRL